MRADDLVTLAERSAAARCIALIEEQQQTFLSPQYATQQPLSSIMERIACAACIDLIRKEFGLEPDNA
jgi:hypothetical protein